MDVHIKSNHSIITHSFWLNAAFKNRGGKTTQKWEKKQNILTDKHECFKHKDTKSKDICMNSAESIGRSYVGIRENPETDMEFTKVRKVLHWKGWMLFPPFMISLFPSKHMPTGLWRISSSQHSAPSSTDDLNRAGWVACGRRAASSSAVPTVVVVDLLLMRTSKIRITLQGNVWKHYVFRCY